MRDGDVMHVVPEIDLPEIVSYAREKKVGIILWVVAKVLDDKLEGRRAATIRSWASRAGRSTSSTGRTRRPWSVSTASPTLRRATA